MKNLLNPFLSAKTRLLLTVSAVVVLACWGIALIQQGPNTPDETTVHAITDLAIAAPIAPTPAPTQLHSPTQATWPQQAATVLLGLIATGGLTVLAAHAFEEHMHGCGCVSLLAAVGIVALLAALFCWV